MVGCTWLYPPVGGWGVGRDSQILKFYLFISVAENSHKYVYKKVLHPPPPVGFLTGYGPVVYEWINGVCARGGRALR